MNIYSYFEKAYKSNPGNLALFVKDAGYSYKQIYDYAAQIAVSVDAGKSSFTGLLAHRSVLAFAGVLGILRSGNAYVPLNPGFPPERLAFMIEFPEMETIIVEERYLQVLEKILKLINKKFRLVFTGMTESELDLPFLHGHTVIAADTPVNSGKALHKSVQSEFSDHYAYMLFTSGSTGKPKAVAVKHKNVMCYVENMNNMNSFSSSDRFSNTFDLTFDLSVHDMFVSWSNGASLYCIPEDALMAPAKFVRNHELTCWFSVPSLANVMDRFRMLKPGTFPNIRYSLFCGEPLKESLAEKWQKAAPNSILKNIYGPAETTIGISEYEYQPGKRKSANGILSIGKIFSGNKSKIVDEHLNEVNTGQTGELLLCGKQVVEKYWNNHEKTAGAFVDIKQEKWYKTGDLVKADDEDDLFFMGRKDFQVKIQGNRVELNEIDFVISQFLKNDNVLTIFLQKDEYSSMLVACINDDPENEIKQTTEIINECKKKLPAYMVPESIVFLESFPQNKNGKTDRNKLTEIVRSKLL